ncbi:MAG: FAD-dependent oxidoreductase [Opitutales bacterium]|nr:FAD-dependent oxidoreductase [Opitutales bacterium]
MDKIQEPARSIPVISEVDVCVLGGSCTGVFAAVRAARRGLRVAVVEKTNRFGGVATNGLVCIWHNDLDDRYEEQIIAGLSLETVVRLQRRNAVLVRERSPDSRYVLNTEELTIELDGLIREHGIEPWLHTFYCRAVVGEDHRIDAVLVENKDGRGSIKARAFIDATGDGDLAKDCGYPFSVRPDLQPPTTCAKIAGLEGIDMRSFYNEHRDEFDVPKDAGWNCTIPRGGLVRLFAETHVFGANVADARQWTAAEMEGRRHIRAMMDMVRKHLPEREKDLCLLDLCSSIGTRETRRFRADYQLTEKDVLYGRRFDDAIANGTYRVDIHYHEGGGHIFRYLDGREVSIRHDERVWSRWRPKEEEPALFYQIPYRTMVRPECPNLIMAGRMIDADPGAYGAIRVMITMNQTGEAAGEAAAFVCNGEPAAKVDPRRLREALRDGGSIVL